MSIDNTGLPSSEDLDAVVEEQAIADATVTKVNGSDLPVVPPNDTKCFICGSVAERICTQCGQDFCVTHFCPVHELAQQSEPLPETNSTTHPTRPIPLPDAGC